MNAQDLLHRLVSQLERAGVRFMVTGSLASGYHGEPRSTYDINLVIEAEPEQIDRLTEGLAGQCYVSASAARDALRQRTMFNVVDLQTGMKADFIVRKDRPFSIAEFQRRQPAVILGTSTFVVSAEDCILSKLEWASMSESERQYRDALKVACVSGARLDRNYLKRWANDLDVEKLLDRLLREATLA